MMHLSSMHLPRMKDDPNLHEMNCVDLDIFIFSQLKNIFTTSSSASVWVFYGSFRTLNYRNLTLEYPLLQKAMTNIAYISFSYMFFENVTVCISSINNSQRGCTTRFGKSTILYIFMVHRNLLMCLPVGLCQACL